jgi:hypothetical protein
MMHFGTIYHFLNKVKITNHSCYTKIVKKAYFTSLLALFFFGKEWGGEKFFGRERKFHWGHYIQCFFQYSEKKFLPAAGQKSMEIVGGGMGENFCPPASPKKNNATPSPSVSATLKYLRITLFIMFFFDYTKEKKLLYYGRIFQFSHARPLEQFQMA